VFTTLLSVHKYLPFNLLFLNIDVSLNDSISGLMKNLRQAIV